jgi:CheY-like chemotaxis protein
MVMATPAKKRTVLVVDDESDVLESIADFVGASHPDLDVLTAHSGPEALNIVRDRRVDLIVSDLRMPGMDGIEFLHDARVLQPRSSRMLLTAYREEALADRALIEAGVVAILSKPFDLLAFNDAIDAALAS